ncbi:MAG TPA: FG-GAP-like repeat-containing protein, partial [Paucimonas sp.]|nr:FG-GAP-like repeat-containing protein [Paucimonas sp.]
MSTARQPDQGTWNVRKLGRLATGLVLSLLSLGAHAQAGSQVSVSDGGTPSYSFPIAVPPGIAGMAPNLNLLYSASSVNGPVGYGWTVQGISTITRCPGNKLIDGSARAVDYTANDKLCLDGQRLIQTDAAGTVSAAQQNDSLGGSGMVREYRTEKDMYARIRAYGMAGGDANNGPAYFKVWTKSGQVYEYGVNSNATANAQITAQGKTVVVAWPVSRISDTVGNYIDFQYEQRDVAWGSGPTEGSPTAGHEWNLAEVRYTGNGSQVPVNKVVFEYVDRADNAGGAQDRGEAYHQGSKNVSIRLLNKVRTFINWPANQASQPAGAVQVKTIRLTYDKGPVSGRSRLKQITECNGNESKCLPPTTFNYASGGYVSYATNFQFRNGELSTLVMQSTSGNYGVVPGNFLGTGRTDILRWSDTPGENQLYRSGGDGGFSRVWSFNITDQHLFKSDGCYASTVADFNGDGMTDILRIMQAYTTSGGVSCGTQRHILYLSNGDGSFRSIDVVGIDFSKRKSITVVRYDCLQPRSSTYVPNCTEPGDNYLGTSQSTGFNFHLLDVNSDGLLDIVTAMMPGHPPTTNPPSDATQCATLVCTRVYLGQPNGGFVEKTDTNVAHRSLYADPQLGSSSFWRKPYVADLNGDGAPDLMVDTGVWISRGDGNFDIDPAATGMTGCANPLDFNGDGRTDCLFNFWVASAQHLSIADGTYTPKKTANFNLVSNGQELYGFVSNSTVANVGIELADFDGDGRDDILRWKDDPSQNTVYLSNGDGTFRTAPGFNLTTSAEQLQKSDGSASFVVGDFTGRGATEILRLKANPSAGSDATRNLLYVKTDSTPPDQLVSVTSSTGLTTTLAWVPLSNPSSGSLGTRYTSDRGTANAAAYPKVDLTMPTYVVATTVAGSGVGSSTLTTEYSYAGLKAAHDGRGWLGFRETRKQSPAPNGSNLTVLTQYLQDGANTGMASLTETRAGLLNAANPQVLSRSTFIYCDKTAAAGAEASATSASPCPTTAKVRRPYLYKSTEEGWDLNGNALPVVTTTNTFNNSGDPTQIVATTTGTALGLSQTFTKTTTNQYYADNTSGDTWILGRLQKATVLSSVPNSLGSIATGYGTAPYANATQGSATTVTINPSALTVNASGPGTASGIVTANANGGVAPYTYAWTRTAGSRTTISNAAIANPTISAALNAGDNFTESWKVTVTDASGITATASVNATFTTPGAAVLSLTSCSSVTPTTSPTAASMSCTLSNTGQSGVSSISYATAAGTSVTGPTGACAAGATCGTVKVTTGTSAGTYSGSVTATPNTGSAASANYSLTVNAAPVNGATYVSHSVPTTMTAGQVYAVSVTLQNS